MASTSHQISAGAQANAAVGRRFFTGMALAMLAVAIAGFGPSLVHTAGRRAPLPPLVAVHGALFFVWLIIYLIQSRLIATRHIGFHRRVGIAAAFLLAAMVPIAYASSVAMVRRGFDLSGDQRIDHNAVLTAWFQIGDLLLFTPLAVGAIAFRRRPDIHKRLMLFANILILNAPLTHFIGHNPRLFPMIGPLIEVFMAMFLIPAVARDVWLTKKFRPLTVGLALAIISFGPLGEFVIGPSETWQRLASWLVR